MNGIPPIGERSGGIFSFSACFLEHRELRLNRGFEEQCDATIQFSAGPVQRRGWIASLHSQMTRRFDLKAFRSKPWFKSRRSSLMRAIEASDKRHSHASGRA